MDHKPVQARPKQVTKDRPAFNQNPTHKKPVVVRHQQKGRTKPKPIWRPVIPSAAPSGLVHKPDPQDSSRLNQESPEITGTAGTQENHGQESDNVIVVYEKVSDGEERNLKLIMGEECQISRDATKWLLRLRDGRNLVLPLMCHYRLSGSQDSCLALPIDEEREEPIDSPVSSDDEEGTMVTIDDSDSRACSDPDEAKDDTELEETSPAWIEPLAMSFLAEEAENDATGGDTSHPPTPSEWSLQKLTEFGEYLGASYEGFEDRVLRLLSEIESAGLRRPNSMSKTPKTTTAQRGHRELRGLLSTVNYEAGHSRRTTVNSGGPFLLQ